jgi:hypothetical protein
MNDNNVPPPFSTEAAAEKARRRQLLIDRDMPMHKPGTAYGRVNMRFDVTLDRWVCESRKPPVAREEVK